MAEPEKDPNRGEDGRFLPGNRANPTGENGLKGKARWEYLVEWYRENWTVDEIRLVATDMDRLGKMTVEHAQVITHLAATIAGGKERGKERERLYDRIFGRPKQTTELVGKDGQPLFNADTDAEDVESKLLPELAVRKPENPS